MRCGMCVGQCPTYKLFQLNEETPRARIRTIEKILAGGETVSASELVHLNSCLLCRACETACPSRMAYGSLFDNAQAVLSEGRRRTILAASAFKLIESKLLRRALITLITLYIRSGLQSLVRRSGLLKMLNLVEADGISRLPSLSGMADRYPAKKKTLGKVALFTGCLTEPFDRETLNAATDLLNAIGYDVLIPKGQTCCGAIHQHNGKQQSVPDFIRRNREAFAALDIDAVVFIATGCGAMLDEYPQDDEPGVEFHERLFDVDDFLLQHWPDRLRLKSCYLKVAVHEPCSQRNVLKNQKSVYALLQKIPGIDVQPLSGSDVCCGAGGAYMLTHPENAARLRDMKLQAIASAAPDVVVSANFGCALYLNSAESSPTVKVIHPLKLLADCL
ncbi:(Fe-S)-binding protein [Methylotuvimicrobium buryatense]|uniref:Glycolate oxidase iron-sulfur subunit n=2 Tax=Methylotuvimicrobium buryatense TaxID=95641 RepID=A0A4P9UW38_METBY|nr:(Fe-S)-binding protein [Methylotuvimicrobium buryatense]